MTPMTSRERVLRTFRFEETDRAPYDLMEAIVWPELQRWCAEELGLADNDAIFDHFDVDFRWFWTQIKAPEGINIFDIKYTMPFSGDYSDSTMQRPLANVQTVEEMLRVHDWIDPTWWDIEPAHIFREKYPDKAIAMLMPWMHPFMMACDCFGIEETLMRLQMEDEVLLAFFERHNRFVVESLDYCCGRARGAVDICWIMDDIASQRALMMNPESWRQYLKPLLRRQVEAIHKHGVLAMFHSCGAIRAILPDLIEIGMDGTLPFQTTAEGMDVESIAREFGGKIAFYGGMDIQQLLTFGTEEEVRREVRRNVDAFAQCGGYIVANSHHCIENVKPENMRAMMEEARGYQEGRSKRIFG